MTTTPHPADALPLPDLPDTLLDTITTYGLSRSDGDSKQLTFTKFARVTDGVRALIRAAHREGFELAMSKTQDAQAGLMSLASKWVAAGMMQVAGTGDAASANAARDAFASALASQPAQEQVCSSNTAESDQQVGFSSTGDEQHLAGSVVEVSYELVSVGGQLANVAFNWAQRAGHVLTGDDVAMLDKLRKQWDAALKATAGGVA